MKARVLPPVRRKMVDTSAFKDLPFMLFISGSFLAFQGLFIPFFYLQFYAISERITSEDLAFYLLSILNAGSIIGRIVPNILADKLGPMNVIVPCALITGILVFCLISIHSVGPMIVFTLFFGFFSGSFVSLPPTVIVHLTPDRRFIGTRMGMCFACVAVGALIGTPIGGAILKASGFTALWVYGAVLTTVGSLVIYSSRVAYKGWNPMIKA
jgi:predicted MFS family arabinose efflux permease